MAHPSEVYFIADLASDRSEAERRVIARVQELIGSEERARAWFNYQPLPDFDNKTPRQLVNDGQEAAITLHLDTLEDGVYA